MRGLKKVIKVSDYVIKFISGLGVDSIFFVAGGGAMHLDDSLGRNKDVEGVCMLHEQGASIAAEAYARIKEGYGCCLVTSGPGATNALTGLAGAYMDSIPVIFISGQVKRDDLRPDGLRQFGIQEVDIISMCSSYTKYAVQVRKPDDIRYEMEKAAKIAVNGRPGPVWIDVPLDVQASEVEPDELAGYEEKLPEYPAKKEYIDSTIELFNQSKRPVILLGNGIRLSHAVADARILYEYMGVPVLTSWNGIDLIEDENPLFYGRPGIVGHRAANFIQQQADFVLTIGSRLNLLNTGYNYEGFLRNAHHIMVDIDENEMNKKSVHPEIKAVCDAGSFIRALMERKSELDVGRRNAWIRHCDELYEKFPPFIPEQDARQGFVSNYHLAKTVSDQMTGDDIYQFTSSGTTVDITMKSFRIKLGQRAFLTKGLAAMGYDIPACIGSCIASGGKRTVCITGDGSAAMNMQELEVIHRLKLPVKLFISDNKGYSMIYGSQNGNFKGHLTGCTSESGLTLPDFVKIAGAFGIRSTHIENEEELEKKVSEVLEFGGPVVCTVNTDITQKILPKQCNYMRKDGQMASRPLEDMAPLLDRDILEECMREE